MVMNKGIQVPEGQAPMHKKKGSKTPQENAKKVFLNDVAPDMGFKIVFRGNHNNAQCAQ
ncbi:unnamed protein product [marine sediment metagenome]|uniref:Uncharacterized protein n=1 Tax=marine sediment metagenome TaxID=412755 RepID=X1V1U0_9ZZZZ